MWREYMKPTLLLLLAGILLASGCVDPARMQNTTTDNRVGDTTISPTPSDTPTGTIDTTTPTTTTTPAEGTDTTVPSDVAPSFTANVNGSANTGNKVIIYIHAENFSTASKDYEGPNLPNSGHFHYFIDEGTFIESMGGAIGLDNMTPGKHSVKIRMQNNDHSNYLVNGSPIEKTVNFTVIGHDPSFSIDPIVVDGTNAKVNLNVFDFTVDAINVGKANADETGHFHWFLTKEGEIEGEYNMITTTSFTIPDLESGNYLVRVAMYNNDHTKYLTKGYPVEATASFTIV